MMVVVRMMSSCEWTPRCARKSAGIGMVRRMSHASPVMTRRWWLHSRNSPSGTRVHVRRVVSSVGAVMRVRRIRVIMPTS